MLEYLKDVHTVSQASLILHSGGFRNNNNYHRQQKFQAKDGPNCEKFKEKQKSISFIFSQYVGV